MATLSDKARRDEFILENEVEQLEDPFLQQGLKMAVDGSDAHVIETTMRMEIMAMQERHKSGKKFFDLIKLYDPATAWQRRSSVRSACSAVSAPVVSRSLVACWRWP